MGRALRHSGLWVAAVALGLGWGARGSRGEGAGEGPPRVLCPADKCVLESGKFELLCVAPDSKVSQVPSFPLKVDGEPRNWAPYAPPVRLARLDLTPGPHELAIGPKTLKVFVRGDAGAAQAPSAWPLLKSHPGGVDGWKDCAACHELKQEEGATTVGKPNTPTACVKCHPPAKFELTHFHPLAPLASCQMCHALHGSGNPSLLKAPVKELCAACHD